MRIRVLRLSRGFHCALLAAMLLFPFAAAQAQAQAPAASAPAKSGGARAYWCKSPNGVAVMQLESCAPGTELRSEPVGPHGAVAPKPAVQAPLPPLPPAEIERRTQAAAQRAAAAPEQKSAADYVPRGDALKAAVVSLLKLLGFGLLVGLIGKVMKRSFWRWMGVGWLVWIALVALKLIKF
jgi:hypothetical protein